MEIILFTCCNWAKKAWIFYTILWLMIVMKLIWLISQSYDISGWGVTPIYLWSMYIWSMGSWVPWRSIRSSSLLLKLKWKIQDPTGRALRESVRYTNMQVFLYPSKSLSQWNPFLLLHSRNRTRAMTINLTFDYAITIIQSIHWIY